MSPPQFGQKSGLVLSRLQNGHFLGSCAIFSPLINSCPFLNSISHLGQVRLYNSSKNALQVLIIVAPMMHPHFNNKNGTSLCWEIPLLILRMLFRACEKYCHRTDEKRHRAGVVSFLPHNTADVIHMRRRLCGTAYSVLEEACVCGDTQMVRKTANMPCRPTSLQTSQYLLYCKNRELSRAMWYRSSCGAV